MLCVWLCLWVFFSWLTKHGQMQCSPPWRRRTCEWSQCRKSSGSRVRRGQCLPNFVCLLPKYNWLLVLALFIYSFPSLVQDSDWNWFATLCPCLCCVVFPFWVSRWPQSIVAAFNHWAPSPHSHSAELEIHHLRLQLWIEVFILLWSCMLDGCSNQNLQQVKSWFWCYIKDFLER